MVVPSIDSAAKKRTDQLLSWLAGSVLTDVCAIIYKCFNDYLLKNVDIYKGSWILPFGDVITNNYFDWLVKLIMTDCLYFNICWLQNVHIFRINHPQQEPLTGSSWLFTLLIITFFCNSLKFLQFFSVIRFLLWDFWVWIRFFTELNPN